MMLVQQVGLFYVQYRMKRTSILIIFVLFLFVGEYGRKFFCMINTVLMDFGIGGIVQPILASAALVASPIVSALLVICMCIWGKIFLCYSHHFNIDLDALLHRCSRGMYDTAMYHLIVRRLARVPAHDTFLARRIAGPGLAAEYFYQVSSPEVLAALESLIEQKELAMYRKYVESLLIKPINDYRLVSLFSPKNNRFTFALLQGIFRFSFSTVFSICYQ